jgi:Domain of unknown function (DUF6883)/Domain of unknown function (DUF4926)
MTVPNSDNAAIAEDKLVKYLLNLEHPKGRSKARLLVSMGYEANNWQVLAGDIRRQHLTQEVTGSAENEYGTQYEIVAPLTGPSGRTIPFRSVWQIDTGTDVPPFELYRDVILTTDVPEHGLCAGDVGTLVERHVVPGKDDGYSVEFFDMTGRTVAVVTVSGHALRAPTPADRPAIRTLAKAGS